MTSYFRHLLHSLLLLTFIASAPIWALAGVTLSLIAIVLAWACVVGWAGWQVVRALFGADK